MLFDGEVGKPVQSRPHHHHIGIEDETHLNWFKVFETYHQIDGLNGR